MTQDINPSTPLNVGRILKTTSVLCRSNLKSYLGIALRSWLWGSAYLLIILGFIGLAILIFMVSKSIFGEGASPWVIVFLVIGLLIPLFYSIFFCFGKSLVNLALISRLAYRELTNQPETPRAGRQQISFQHWQFFRLQLFLSFLLSAISLGLQIAQVCLLLPIQLVFEAESLATVLGVYLALVSYGIYLWFYAHWFISEVILAVESNVSSSATIEHSWDLSKRHSLRILLVIIVASLITIPLYFGVIFLALITLLPAIIITVQSGDWTSLAAQASLWASVAWAFFLFMTLVFLISPFWQVLKGVVYYELRSQINPQVDH